MKYWSVTSRHTAFVEAETEAEAKDACADQVRENALAAECEADEIDENDYDTHWSMQDYQGEI